MCCAIGRMFRFRSKGPPAGAGTTMRPGRVGQSVACATTAVGESAAPSTSPSAATHFENVKTYSWIDAAPEPLEASEVREPHMSPPASHRGLRLSRCIFDRPGIENKSKFNHRIR